MNEYRIHGDVLTVITSCSDLLALSQARLVTGNRDVRISRRSEGYFVPVTIDQMLHGRHAKENLIGAFGSASAKTLKKAERIYA
jgi:hypothetical protein